MTFFRNKIKFLLFFTAIAGFFVIFSSNALASQAHPPGTLIISNGTVWQISLDGTQRLGFDSLEKFNSNRFNLKDAISANATDLALSETIISWGDGVLFLDNGTVFQVSGNAKHGFASQNAFLGSGFAFSQAIKGNLGSLPAGDVIVSPTSQHLSGTFIIDSTKTIWIMSAAGRKGIPSMAVLTSYSINLNQIVPANAADMATPVTSVLTYNTGAIVADQGIYYAVNFPYAWKFTNTDCLQNFGYNPLRAILGSVQGLQIKGEICGDPKDFIGSYSFQNVATSRGNFDVHILKYNLASGKVQVITDTASTLDCLNNCATKPLLSYIQDNGATSGMNGTYFCPPDYPDCAGKTGSFFWKVYNSRLGYDINETNGLGENDPFLAFDSSMKPTYFPTWMGFEQSGFKAVAGINSIALVENKNIAYNEAKLDDKQRNTKTNRGAIGIAGNILYLVQTTKATVPDAAEVMKTLGVDYAINLDGGGSTAMVYQNSYKLGPGRLLPNAVLIKELP